MGNIKVFLFCLFLFANAQKIEPGPSFIIRASEDAARQIEAQNGLVNDTVLLNRVKSVAQKMMRASDLRTVFECKILNTDVINAFALPAGPVYVTMGMISFLDSLKTEKSKSMLAGILGHEIAHICLRHSVALMRLESFVKEGRVSIPDDIVEIFEKGYTMQQEFEADEYGIIYAMRAGYEFESIMEFYKTIRAHYGETPPGDEKYDDHPRITERIARLYEVRAALERDYDQWNFGVEALNEGRYNDAISHFKLFTTTFQNSAYGWVNLGTGYLFEAMSKMESPSVLFMVIFYNEPNFRLRGIPDELTYAEESFKKAMEVDSSYDVVYYSNMGIIYALRREYDKALEFTQRALFSKEAEHFFYNNLGNIYYLKKDYEAAVASYTKAIELNDKWLMPKYNLALTYEKIERKDLAIQIWQELLNVSGYNKEAIKHLAMLDKKFKSEETKVKPETTLAGISLDMSEDSVRKMLGEPGNQTILENMRALEYSDKNMVIFIRDNKVSGILVQPGFSEKTSKGIGIGSSVPELCDAYGLPDDIVQQKDMEQWLYTKYGMLIHISEGKVMGFQIVRASKDA
uniref:Tetratricopeptide repeat protein n=1 Tax=candidate division WOR-3 bacterium TaxID=2052148 RepID=A0A7V0Z524_UNCW3